MTSGSQTEIAFLKVPRETTAARQTDDARGSVQIQISDTDDAVVEDFHLECGPSDSKEVHHIKVSDGDAIVQFLPASAGTERIPDPTQSGDSLRFEMVAQNMRCIKCFRPERDRPIIIQ